MASYEDQSTGGLPSDVDYTDGTNDLLVNASENGGDVSNGVQNTSDTASSTATLRATVGASAAGARVELVHGTTTWRGENRAGLLYFRLGTSDYAVFDSTAGNFRFGPAGAVGATSRSVVIAHWNAQVGLLAGPSLEARMGASEKLNIFVSSDNAKGICQYAFDSTAGVYKRVLSWDNRAGTPQLQICQDGGEAILSGRLEGKKGADIASAGTITAGFDGNVFAITGTTTINYLTTTGWQAGSEVTFLFGTSVTVAHNTGSVPANTAPFLLSGAANMSATANDSLTVIYDGTSWREKCRTVI